MGAPTSNRKRGDEYLGLSYLSHSQSSSNFQVSKKPRFSYMNQSLEKPVSSSKGPISRISRYPEIKTPLRREVHAPCRILKFGCVLRSQDSKPAISGYSEKEEFGHGMGNFLSNNYYNAKKNAVGALRYLKKDKEVLEQVNEPQKKVISEDSSVEEVEVIEDGRDVWSLRELDSNKLEKINLRPSSSLVVTDLNNDILRVDNEGKMLDSQSMRYNKEDHSAYKKLLESSARRSYRLKALDFDITLTESRLDSLRALRPPKPVEEAVEEVPREPFIPLTQEEEIEVQRAFSANRKKVLSSHKNSGIDITGEVLQCLRPKAWLNDEVINVYLELLKERETRDPQKFLRCHFFNTFFYKKLVSAGSGYNYRAVRRWTSEKKLGYHLLECDKIFVPIHKEIHWCLAVINKKDQKFQYLDSLAGLDNGVLEFLARYLKDEVKDKSGKDINLSSWKLEIVEDLPEQSNGYDCGMFMLKYMDFYSRGLKLSFAQEHMPYFRQRTTNEILKLRAE